MVDFKNYNKAKAPFRKYYEGMRVTIEGYPLSDKENIWIITHIGFCNGDYSMTIENKFNKKKTILKEGLQYIKILKWDILNCEYVLDIDCKL